MNVARDFIDGPFDSELLAVSTDMRSVRVPLPKQWLKNPKVAGAAAYRLDGDQMRFTGRCAVANHLLIGSQM